MSPDRSAPTRDWETSAVSRLERTVASVVDQLRRLADRIETEAAPNIENARIRRTDYSTYGRVAERVVHEVSWGVANLNLSNVIDAASDAALAQQDPKGPSKGSELAAVKSMALYTMLTTLDGWIEGQQANHAALEHTWENDGEECFRRYTPEDIRNMINDAAREVGISPFPLPVKPQEGRS